MTTALVLTSTALRHQFVANALAQRLHVVGVWQEAKAFDPHRYAQTPEDHAVIADHFAARDQAERRDFEEHAQIRVSSNATHRLVRAGELNDAAEVAAMARLHPEIVIVFGTGLLSRELVKTFEGRIVNLHLGLSPYYRGSGTNFWPLVNREPEYVGATIHVLDAGIDTGPILAHVRPTIEPADGPHELGNKTIREAAAVLADAAEAVARGGLRGVAQNGRGRLYQRKDFTADAVRRVYDNFRSGMLAEYLAQQSSRDARLELVTLAVTP